MKQSPIIPNKFSSKTTLTAATASLSALWYQKKFFNYALLPLASIYRFIAGCRRFLFRLQIMKTTQFSVPLIVVGNITVGGTGKTPLVIQLVKFLQEQGWQPGIVSRGYGGKASSYPTCVNSESDPNLVGDEAVLMAAKTNAPVVVDPNRTRAVQTLISNQCCNIVVSDDGLQHYAMGRTFEIAVIDGERGFGNGFCLPAGPLREPIQRLNTVDYIIINGHERVDIQSVKPKQGSSCMQLTPGRIYNLVHPERFLTPSQAETEVIHAVAGIGNPSRFFTTLRQLGYSFIEHIFPDHYIYQKSDLDFGPNSFIIMTEKDAIKCTKFKQTNYWCLPITASLSDQLIKNISNILRK